MNMQQKISAWDGKSTDSIDEVYNRYSDAPTFVSEIIVLIEELPLQKGSTWLLKRHLEDDNHLEPSQISRIYRLLPQLDHWEAKLHLLQCLPFMPISEPDKHGVESFCRECLEDDNKFVRAWAYNGFHELSLQHHEHRDEVKELLDRASQYESASVKARIRNILKNR